MTYRAREGQVSYGEAIGIILLDGFVPYIPGGVGNASTYCFPVRFQVAKGLSVKRIFAKDPSLLGLVIEAGEKLAKEGVKAITADCGFLALFQKELANQLKVPVFLSSLLQLPFISRMLGDNEKVGIITANSLLLDASLLEKVGIDSSAAVYIKGLESKEHFAKQIIEENGILDCQEIEKEVVSSVKEMIQEEPKVRAILLECSHLPPYGAAVQEAVNLPVFDFVTMINHVYSSVVKKRFQGFM